MLPVNKNIKIGNAEIRFRNFAGAQGKYNAAGNRNFCVFLDNELAEILTADGWAVRWLKPRDPEETPQAYMQVSVGFVKFPAEITMITKKGKTKLDESTVKILDWADIKMVDLEIRPYNWEVGGKTGIKPYVKKMFVTLQEDEFEEKYMNIPDSADSPVED